MARIAVLLKPHCVDVNDQKRLVISGIYECQQHFQRNMDRWPEIHIKQCLPYTELRYALFLV